MSTAEEKIVLGSGKLYIDEFVEGVIPADEVLEVEENLLGLISGGADIEYKPKSYEATDDLGIVSKTVLTEEEVTMKSGVMTWNGNTLERICSTARVTEDLVTGKRTVKVGGLQMQNGKKYVIRFLHEDKADGNIRLTIVGTNEAGFVFKFAKDKETVTDVEFKAKPLDSDGTKIIFEEDIPKTV